MPKVDNTHTSRADAKWLRVQDLRDLYEGRPYKHAGQLLFQLQDGMTTPDAVVRFIKGVASYNERMVLCMLLADSLGQCDMRDVMAEVIRSYAGPQ